MKKLPLDPMLSADQTTRFLNSDGEAVSYRLYWNSRSNFWYLDAGYQPLSASQMSYIYGIKVVPRYPLLREYRATFPFKGDFLFMPVTSAVDPEAIGYEEIGRNWFLYWLNADELAAWEDPRGLG